MEEFKEVHKELRISLLTWNMQIILFLLYTGVFRLPNIREMPTSSVCKDPNG